MHTLDTPVKPARQPRPRLGDNFHTVEDLGTHAYRLAALLRAATNAEYRDDREWLVSMARDEAEVAEGRYKAWGDVSKEERA